MGIPERTKTSIDGLRKMVNYINFYYPTKGLDILEIGSWTGCSMQVFAENFKTVTCIDPFEETLEISTEYNMKEVEEIFDSRIKPNVIKERIKSEKFELKKKYDVIYIDGIHSYAFVKQDILKYMPFTRLFLAGHDYCLKFGGVQKAVIETIGNPDKVFPDTSWIKRMNV